MSIVGGHPNECCRITGLRIRSLVFRAICFFVSSDSLTKNKRLAILLYFKEHRGSTRAYHYGCSLKRSDGAKSYGSDSLLGIKRGKAVKTRSK